MIRSLGLLSLPLAFSAPAQAEEGIVTDRPDFVESSDVVGRGRWQLETSVAGERDKVDGIRVRGLSTPTLLRFGLSDTVELRLETDGRSRVSAGGMRSSGWSDISIGTKWHIQDGEGTRPSLAWLLHADLATGSGPFRGQGTRPSLRMSIEWDLPDGYNLGLMPGLYRDRNEDGRRYTGGIMAVTLGRQFGEQVHGFVELAGQQIASARNGGKLLTFDTGVTYLVSDSVQLDSALFFGLNRTSPDLGWTVGLSMKF
ncbi:transporter [Pelomonas sp. KK5]|uniref:transporter n=1 Tax=Pelomonas sp. KK5 TaxID=1855730 RepID=UPI001E3B1D09|nr:transporter [Pelomonas sp. KK5]